MSSTMCTCLGYLDTRGTGSRRGTWTWATRCARRMSRRDYTGRSTRNFRRLALNLRSQRLPCSLCGQPIDYTAEPGTPNSFTVDHVKPRSTHPHLAEDPANLRAAHHRCNTGRGTKTPAPGIGSTSEAW
jgi:5-methylcytosine-specific restriction endonuclease McrA